MDLLGATVPIIQAPMAGATTPAMVEGAMRAGALGSLACAMLTRIRCGPPSPTAAGSDGHDAEDERWLAAGALR